MAAAQSRRARESRLLRSNPMSLLDQTISAGSGLGTNAYEEELYLRMHHSDWSDSYEIDYFHDVLDAEQPGGEVNADETEQLLCGQQKIAVAGGDSASPPDVEKSDGEGTDYKTKALCIRKHDDGMPRKIQKNADGILIPTLRHKLSG